MGKKQTEGFTLRVLTPKAYVPGFGPAELLASRLLTPLAWLPLRLSAQGLHLIGDALGVALFIGATEKT